MAATIEFPRKGGDGIWRTKEELEAEWNKMFSKKIIGRLETRKSQHVKQNLFIDSLIEKIRQGLLTMTPSELEVERCAMTPKSLLDKTFLKKLRGAFNYDGFRNKELVKWSQMINVKVCPYCNHEYTLYVGSGVKYALHQFDHFYSKADYPWLSMCMYNLVPSCSVCNHKKSAVGLSRTINPYDNDLNDKYSFHVSNSNALMSGRMPNDADQVSIELICSSANKMDVKDMDSTFLLTNRYGRHKDIVSEIYDKVYCEKYYKHITGIPDNMYCQLLTEWMNVPPLKEDIGKNPLTKFRQDILHQARDEYRGESI